VGVFVTTLHLGVIEVPYSDASYAAAPKGKRLGRAKRGNPAAPRGSNQQTTGDVAQLLEDKYHIMETFFELHENDIAGMFERSAEGALQNLMAGAPGTISITAEAESEIEARFRQFLSNREMDATGTAGVPTRAARLGVSHRFLHPYARRSSRPSFIDTSLYVSNFHVWSDQ
jgi:hypothetical protein